MLLYPLHQYLGVGELSPTVGVWLAEQETKNHFLKFSLFCLVIDLQTHQCLLSSSILLINSMKQFSLVTLTFVTR